MGRNLTVKETLTHYVGLGVSGRCPRGHSVPLQGGEGCLDSLEAKLQPAHLAGGIGVKAVGFICRVDELSELLSIIQRRRRRG
jgi:hypothetical protein